MPSFFTDKLSPVFLIEPIFISSGESCKETNEEIANRETDGR